MKIQLQTDTLTIFESELFRTTTTLLRGQNHLLIVDPNWLPHEVNFIYKIIEKYRHQGQRLLFFTHSDYDHIIGYEKLKKGGKVIASQNFIDNPGKESILAQINKFDDQYYIKRDYPITYPKVDLPISHEEEKVILGGEVYKFYQARGHNSDGLICLNRTRGILIVGDYLSNIEFPYIYDSIAKYEQTLDLLELIINKESVKILITGHGDHTTDKSEMLLRILESRDYILKLKTTVLTGEKFDLNRLWQRYRFPGIMSEFHEGNLTLARKELLSPSEN